MHTFHAMGHEFAVNDSQLYQDGRLAATLPSGEAEPHPTPSPASGIDSLSLYITDRCNLACVYCFEKRHYGRLGTMSRQTALDAFALLLRHAPADTAKSVSVFFYGGEPLLHPTHLLDIVDTMGDMARTSGHRVSFGMNTNGLTLTPRLAARLLAHDTRISVSLDGPDEVHDRQRAAPNGAPTAAIIRNNLLGIEPRLRRRIAIVFGLMGQQAPYTDFVSFWRDWGCNSIILNLISASLDPPQIRGCLAAIDALAEWFLAEFRAGRVAPLLPFASIVRSLCAPRVFSHVCNAGKSQFACAPDGRLYPCRRFCGEQDYVFGTLREGLHPDRARRAYDAPNPTVQCEDCWARDLCARGCYAERSLPSGTNRCEMRLRVLEVSLAILAATSPAERQILAWAADSTHGDE